VIRFVDIRGADIAGCRFSFWDTVKDRYIGVPGEWAWETFEQFEEALESYFDVLGHNKAELVERCKDLAPWWAFLPEVAP